MEFLKGGTLLYTDQRIKEEGIIFHYLARCITCQVLFEYFSVSELAFLVKLDASNLTNSVNCYSVRLLIKCSCVGCTGCKGIQNTVDPGYY